MKCQCCGQEIRESSTARFDEFWACYPSKVDKVASLKIWKRRKLDAMADVIIAAVRDRVENDQRWIQGYIMSPRRFLLNDNWDDEFNSAPQVATWPTKNSEWEALGRKYHVTPGRGENWIQFKVRVQRAAEAC
jgi:hypothetical protein